MINEKNCKLKELTNWCLDNSQADGFCVFLELQGHVDKLEIYGYLNGWSNLKERSFGFSFYTDNDRYEDEASEVLSELKHIKLEYDKLNTPEEKQRRAEDEKQREKERLKARLAELEG